MNLTVQLSDGQASAQGLTVERWVEQIATQHAQEWARDFHGRAERY